MGEVKVKWEWVSYRVLWEYLIGYSRRHGVRASMARYLLLVQVSRIGRDGIWLPMSRYYSARGIAL